MSLHYQVFGESGTPFIIVHGLFGSIANWRSVARELATVKDDAMENYIVYVVDQRNHGDSPHFDSMQYVDMAEDLDDFISEQGLKDFVLCGHSMGGKAAMLYALSDYASVADMHSLIVLDIAPVTYTHSHAPYLQAMAEIDLASLESRAQVDQLLKVDIVDNATRLFLMQSLARKEGQLSWKLNVPVLQQYMPDIVGFPNDIVEGKQVDMNTLFLYGSQSQYVTESMHVDIHKYFSNATFDSVDAGHWLHVEQRQAMLDSMLNFLK